MLRWNLSVVYCVAMTGSAYIVSTFEITPARSENSTFNVSRMQKSDTRWCVLCQQLPGHDKYREKRLFPPLNMNPSMHYGMKPQVGGERSVKMMCNADGLRDVYCLRSEFWMIDLKTI